MNETRTCVHCRAVKALSEFTHDSRQPDGINRWCAECTRAVFRSYYYRNHDKMINRARRRTREARDWYHAWMRQYRAANPRRDRAHQIVSNAVRRGRLTRQPCEICGNPRADAHHENYNRPFDIHWLCRAHHKEAHVRIRKAGGVA